MQVLIDYDLGAVRAGIPKPFCRIKAYPDAADSVIVCPERSVRDRLRSLVAGDGPDRASSAEVRQIPVRVGTGAVGYVAFTGRKGSFYSRCARRTGRAGIIGPAVPIVLPSSVDADLVRALVDQDQIIGVAVVALRLFVHEPAGIYDRRTAVRPDPVAVDRFADCDLAAAVGIGVMRVAFSLWPSSRSTYPDNMCCFQESASRSQEHLPCPSHSSSCPSGASPYQ